MLKQRYAKHALRYWLLLLGSLLLILVIRIPFRKPSEIAVIFTDPLKKDSQLIKTTDEGTLLLSKQFDAQGVFQLLAKGEDYILPVQYESGYYTYDHQNRVFFNESPKYPLYVIRRGNYQFALYNSGFNKGLLGIQKDGSEEGLIELEGLLTVCESDGKTLYIRSSYLRSDKTFEERLYLVDRKKRLLIDSYTVPQATQCRSLYYEKNKLYMGGCPTKNEVPFTIFDTTHRSFKTYHLTANQESGEIVGPINDFAVYKEWLYILHQGNYIVSFNRSTETFGSHVAINQYPIAADVKGQRLYLLSQGGEKGQKGYIGIYYLKNLELEKILILQAIRETKPQDLKIN